MRERGEADIRRTDVVRHVGELVHEVRQLAQACEIETKRDAHLDLKRGHDRREVAVPHALTVAVDRALDLIGSGAHGGQSIGDTDAAVIVRVDADWTAEVGNDLACRLFNELRQRAAVRLT